MKQKFSLFAASAAILSAFAIFAAYNLTRREESASLPSPTEESVEIYRPVITAEPEPSPAAAPEPIFYYLQSEDDALVLYEIDGELQKEIKRVNFSPDMLPSEDRELLKNGIKAFTLEEGVEIMENFIS